MLPFDSSYIIEWWQTPSRVRAVSFRASKSILKTTPVCTLAIGDIPGEQSRPFSPPPSVRSPRYVAGLATTHPLTSSTPPPPPLGPRSPTFCPPHHVPKHPHTIHPTVGSIPNRDGQSIPSRLAKTQHGTARAEQPVWRSAPPPAR